MERLNESWYDKLLDNDLTLFLDADSIATGEWELNHSEKDGRECVPPPKENNKHIKIAPRF